MTSAQGERIQANCKIIWGDHDDYDLDMETDNWEEYACLVRKDYGLSLGPPLTMTQSCGSENAAWAELDRMLRIWAGQVQRGTPMTKQEYSEIFGGPRGELRNLVSDFIELGEKRKATETTEKTGEQKHD